MKNILFIAFILLYVGVNAQTKVVNEFKLDIPERNHAPLPTALVESEVFTSVITNGEIYEYNVFDGVTLFVTIDGNKVHLLEEKEKEYNEFLFEFDEFQEYPSVYSGYQENINSTFSFYVGKYICIKKDGFIIWDRVLEK